METPSFPPFHFGSSRSSHFVGTSLAGMALTLYTRNNVVISTVVWQFWGSGWIPQVSALGVILILFALIIVGSVRIALARVGEVGSAA